MPERGFSWMIGGPQGSGINVSAETFAKALARGGLHVFGNIEYHSNIKGKHSFYRLRITQQPVYSHLEEVDLLVAMDEETIFGDLYHEFPAHRGHAHEVVPGGGILYDADIKDVPERIGRSDIGIFALPCVEILERAFADAGRPGEGRRYQIMKNTVLLGASVGMLGYDFDLVAQVIREGFKGKGKVAELNVNAARYAYRYARDKLRGDFPYELRPRDERKKQMMIKGVQAVGIGKLRAGCGFQTYYPISPATDESVYLEEHQRRYNMVVLQTEDEVSAIDCAVLAAHGGVRASTSTSGPGFALMPEGLGLAGITEVGLVICLYQRGGPSTGLPTRHEQGDLRFALHVGQSEFPRIVLAPGDIRECFYDTFDAFNYADRYQMPVILMLDKHLASSYITMEPLDASGLKIDRGLLYEPGNGNHYYRYAFTESGLTPRSLPGQEGGIFWTTSDEHDQIGHINEGIGNRIAMMRKRMEKETLAAAEIPEEKKYSLFGPLAPEAIVVSWGSTKGAIIDALDALDPERKRFAFLQLRMLRPFPAEQVRCILERAGRIISIECNYSGQGAGLLREMTGIKVNHKVVKYDGRPFSQNEVIAAVEHALSTGEEEILVSEGKVVPPNYGLKQVEELVELRKRSRKMSPPVVPVPPGYGR